jgi:hypothetical protein
MYKNKQKIYYLVDFENVANKGLEGADKLSKNDYVHLFSTKNGPKMTTATLSTFNSTNLKVHEVPAKNQSVDMHLVSYLGFLIGKDGKSSNYVIVSKDSDYINIIKYWKRENNITINSSKNLIPVDIYSNFDSEKMLNSKENNKANKNNNSSNNNKNNINNNNSLQIKKVTSKPLITKDELIASIIEGIQNSEFNNGNIETNIKEMISLVNKYFGKDQMLVRIYLDICKGKNYEQFKILQKILVPCIQPFLPEISPEPSKLITEFVFTGISFEIKELYNDLFNVLKYELKLIGCDENSIITILDIISSFNADKYNYFLNLYENLKSLFNRKDCNEIFNLLKKIILGDVNYPGILSVLSNSNKKSFNSKKQNGQRSIKNRSINNEVQKILSQERYNENIISYVSSVVSKNHTKVDSKQNIYNLIVSKYGQENGLIIYNVIKKLL